MSELPYVYMLCDAMYFNTCSGGGVRVTAKGYISQDWYAYNTDGLDYRLWKGGWEYLRKYMN